MLFEKIRYCYGETDRITRIIIKAGFSLFLFLCSGALLTYCFGELFYADHTTALLNSEELFYSAKECLGACVIPALLYEILRRAAVM